METGTIELPVPCAIVISKEKTKVADLSFDADVTIKTYKGKVSRVNWEEGGRFLIEGLIKESERSIYEAYQKKCEGIVKEHLSEFELQYHVIES